MKRQEIAACFMAIGLSGSLLAANRLFPSGDGDLADLSRWQASYSSLTELPGTADTVQLGSSSTFTMSSDMDVGGFTFNGKNATLDFASSGNHTLKVRNAQHAFCAFNATIKGGTIDRNGQDFYWFQTSDKETTVTDSCIITNAGTFHVNVWGNSGGKIHLTGASRIYANALVLNKGISGSTSGRSLLEVTGGAKVFTTADWNNSENTAKDIASGGNVLSVSGSGSSVTMAGNYGNGYDCNGNSLYILDEADFSSKTLYVGRSASSGSHYSNSNRLVVVGGTLSMTGGSLYCYGDGNVIAVTNGTVNFKDKTYSYDGGSSSNTKIDIVNSTWKCASFNVGKNVDMHISGSSTVLETTYATQFGFGASAAVGAKLCLDDGFTWKPNIGYGYYLMQNLTNCALTVQNNATLSAWDPANDIYDRIVFCGYSGANNGVSNVICVLSGGTIQGRTIELNGLDNLVVVSNGVISASDSIQFGGGVAGASNNTVVVQGRTSRLSAVGLFYLRNNTTLRVEVPEVGYAPGHVPITARELSLAASGCKFEIDVSQFQPQEKAELTLVSFDTDLTTDQKNFLMSAELPPRYSLDVVGNRNLVLKAKGEIKGFRLIFR